MHPRHLIPCLIVAAVAAIVFLTGQARSGTLLTLGVALACPLATVSMVRAINDVERPPQPAMKVSAGDDYYD